MNLNIHIVNIISPFLCLTFEFALVLSHFTVTFQQFVWRFAKKCIIISKAFQVNSQNVIHYNKHSNVYLKFPMLKNCIDNFRWWGNIWTKLNIFLHTMCYSSVELGPCVPLMTCENNLIYFNDRHILLECKTFVDWY